MCVSVIKLLTSVASRWIRESACARAGQIETETEIEGARERGGGGSVSLCESFHYEYEYCAKMFDILSISSFVASVQSGYQCPLGMWVPMNEYS